MYILFPHLEAASKWLDFKIGENMRRNLIQISPLKHIFDLFLYCYLMYPGCTFFIHKIKAIIPNQLLRTNSLIKNVLNIQYM